MGSNSIAVLLATFFVLGLLTTICMVDAEVDVSSSTVRPPRIAYRAGNSGQGINLVIVNVAAVLTVLVISLCIFGVYVWIQGRPNDEIDPTDSVSSVGGHPPV